MGSRQIVVNPPLVTISILSYNDERTIEAAVKSAALQCYPAIEILVLDNNSKDGSREILENLRDRLPCLRTKHLKERGIADTIFRYHVLFLNENIGFAKGHNRVIFSSQGAFVLLLNSDAGLDDQFVANAIPYFTKDAKLGAVQGKLFRYNAESGEVVRNEETQKPVLDTTGLMVFRNRRIINRGQGQPDIGKFDRVEEVFGADGAAPIYKKEALEDAKICIGENPVKCEYLDEDFFAYKEDVDIAWRLRLAGWKALYVPSAIGYHERSSGESAETSYVGILKERKKLSRKAKYLAFKNQRLMQMKNELFGPFLRHIFFWGPKEIASWLYVLLFERFTWKAFGDIICLAPKMRKKRRMIMKNKRATAQDMTRWFQ